jgi:site-specific DNA recombinase
MTMMDAYVRVSRVGGRSGETFKSPEIQRSQAHAWAQLNGVTIGKTVEELDVSGGKQAEDRELAKLIERVEEGSSDGIIVPKISRFARDLYASVAAAKRITDAGGRLVATEEGYDSAQPGSQVILGTLSGLAEQQREQLAAGWRDATSRAVASGIHVASKAPLGYLRADQVDPRYDAQGKLIRDGRLVLDPDAAPAIRRAFEMRGEGASYSQIADYLKDALDRAGFAKSSVAGIFKNRAYLGEARGPHGAVKKEAHEALVPPELFAAVQPRTGQYHPRDGSLASQARLAGLITCASCGNKLRTLGSTNPKTGERVPSYVCMARYGKGNCEAPAAARVSLVDEYVGEQLSGAWDEVTTANASAEQNYLKAKEAARQAEEALDAWVDDPAIATGLSADRFQRGLLARQAALEDAQRALWDHDDPGVPEDTPVVWLDGKPWVVETWDDIPAARRHLRKHIAEVTLAKADPKRRRWQPLSERITIRWRGDDA